jgi:uncharacterized membrane protein YeiB
MRYNDNGLSLRRASATMAANVPSDRPTTAAPPRLRFLDACRGLAVLGMLLANMMNVFLRRVPDVLRHNQGDALRLFDFPAPAFQFLIGVSLVLYLAKRRRLGAGPRRARLAAVVRFGLLMALGLALDAIGTLTASAQWGVLQTLALGGIVATAVAGWNDAAVAALAALVMAVYSGTLNGDVHHEPLAAVAFVPLTLAGLIVGRGLAAADDGFVGRALAVAVSGLGAAAVATAFGVPFNKIRGTSSFVGVATTASALLLLATAASERRGVRLPGWLVAVGANALTAWVLQYVLVYYPAWLLFPAWRRLPLGAGMAASVATLTALTALTIALGRRGIRIPI